MSILYLVRHGQTQWNREGRIQGATDIPLNDLGRWQAQRLGRRLAEVAFDAVVSSPLSRCQETAAIALAGRGLAVRLEPELREHAWGSWEGLTAEERRERFPDAVAALARGERYLPDDAESWDALAERAERARAVLDGLGGEHVLVVTHGGTLNALVSNFLGLPPTARARMRFDSCSLTQIEVTPERAIIFRINDNCHVDGGAES